MSEPTPEPVEVVEELATDGTEITVTEDPGPAPEGGVPDDNDQMVDVQSGDPASDDAEESVEDGSSTATTDSVDEVEINVVPGDGVESEDDA